MLNLCNAVINSLRLDVCIDVVLIEADGWTIWKT